MIKDFFELPELRPTRPDVLRLIPLGGLEKVGRDMMVLETEGKILIIDYRMLLPEKIQPGVNLILPDFPYIKDRVNQTAEMVLTHGHEDHIGAVPYLLKHRSDIPVYGSGLTLILVEPRLREHRLPVASLWVETEGQHLDLDPFHLEFRVVGHSILDTLVVMVRTKTRPALVTGDFKTDQLPLDGRITDLRTLARWGEKGVDLFCVDSTNVEVPGFIPSGREIDPVLDDVFYHATGQIVVASFASYVHRVQQILNAIVASNRRVALVGCSTVRNMKIATDKEFLRVPSEVLIDFNDANSLPSGRRVYTATGPQGELMAALSRIIDQEHHSISISKGDTMILASNLISGNETSVRRVINRLMRLGVRITHKGNSKVHASGRAAAGKLFYAYNIIEPKNVVPIHREIRHLAANEGLAVRTGVKSQNVMLAESGVCVEVEKGRAEIVGQMPCDYIYVDGTSIGELGEQELYDRRALVEEGFVAVYVVMRLTTGTILAGPTMTARGVTEGAAVFRDIELQIADTLAGAVNEGKSTVRDMEWMVRRTLGRWMSKRLCRAPMIMPLVVEAE